MKQDKAKQRYRDHRDVMADILSNLYHDGSGAGITYLMYTTGTAWNNLLLLLDELLDKGMVTSKVLQGMKLKGRRHHRVFFITAKGNKFLHLYKDLKENLK